MLTAHRPLLPRTRPNSQRTRHIPGNYVHDNGDAGIALLESFGADVSDNTFENNKYGVRFSVGCGDNVFFNNTMFNSTK